MLHHLKPNNTRADNALKVFYAFGIMILFGIILDAVIYSLYNSSETERNTLLTYYDETVGTFYLIYVGVYIVSIVFFLMWFRRCYHNLGIAIGKNRLEYSESWAVWSWFIPFISLYRPYKILKEIWTDYQIVINKGKILKSTNIINWFWFFEISELFYSIHTSIKVEAFDILLKNEIICYLFTFIALILQIKIIKQIHQFENELLIHYQIEDITSLSGEERDLKD